MKKILVGVVLTLFVVSFVGWFGYKFAYRSFAGEEIYEYKGDFGKLGYKAGEFMEPRGIAVDASGDVVYVADTLNSRIQKFSSDGVFAGKYGKEIWDYNGPHFYEGGSGDDEFMEPEGIAIDASGNVYVADYKNHRIQKLNSSGVFLGWLGKDKDGVTGFHDFGSGKIGTYGTEEGAFAHPAGIAVDGAGNLYVSDYYNSCIQKVDSKGKYMARWGSKGTGDGQFAGFSLGIAVDAVGNVYAADRDNHRIQKFDANGMLMGWWGKDNQGNPGWHAIGSGKVGAYGGGDGAFKNPTGVATAVDGSGNVNVYVADFSNNRIQKFNSKGEFITKFDVPAPRGVAVSSKGIVYVLSGSCFKKFAITAQKPTTTTTSTSTTTTTSTTTSTTSTTTTTTTSTTTTTIKLVQAKANFMIRVVESGEGKLGFHEPQYFSTEKEMNDKLLAEPGHGYWSKQAPVIKREVIWKNKDENIVYEIAGPDVFLDGSGQYACMATRYIDEKGEWYDKADLEQKQKYWFGYKFTINIPKYPSYTVELPRPKPSEAVGVLCVLSNPKLAKATYMIRVVEKGEPPLGFHTPQYFSTEKEMKDALLAEPGKGYDSKQKPVLMRETMYKKQNESIIYKEAGNVSLMGGQYACVTTDYVDQGGNKWDDELSLQKFKEYNIGNRFKTNIQNYPQYQVELLRPDPEKFVGAVCVLSVVEKKTKKR